MSRLSLIKSFPDDEISRVVFQYGGVKKNNSAICTTPLVKVLLVEIDDTQQLNPQNCVSTFIKLNEIHKVKLGSIWKGQIFEYQNPKFYKRTISKYLNFFLSLSKAKTMKIKEIKEILNLNKRQEEFFTNYLSILNQPQNESFNEVNYTILRSSTGINVVLSPIQVLDSIFLNNTKIKEQLLTQTIDQLIDSYFWKYSINEKELRFDVQLKDKAKKFNDKTIKFLAQLALHKPTQEVVNLMQISLERINFNENYRDTERFPIIFPPQIDHLGLHTLGFWIKPQDTFFVIRITSIVSLDDYTVTIS